MSETLIRANFAAFDGVDAPDKVPSEIRLLKAGENEYASGDGNTGKLIFDDEAAKTVMARYQKRGLKLKADYEHQSLAIPPVIAPASAKSWKPEVREDGLYATQIQWTKKARQMIADGEYDYFSIAAHVDPKSRRVVEMINFALTNTPAANGIEPLIAASKNITEEKQMKTVLVALGLKAEADETEAFAAVNALREFERDTMTALGAKSMTEAAGLIIALKAKADKSEAVEAELVKLKNEQMAKEKAAVIDKLILRGVAPVKRPELEKQELSALSFALSMLPTSTSPALPPTDDVPADSAKHGVSAEEMAVLKRIGVKPEDYAKTKAAYKRGFQKGEE